MSGIALSCLSGFRTIIILWIFFIFQLFNPIKFPIKTEKWHHLMLLFWLSLSLTKSCLFMWSSDLSAGGGCSMLKKEHSPFIFLQNRKGRRINRQLLSSEEFRWKNEKYGDVRPTLLPASTVHECMRGSIVHTHTTAGPVAQTKNCIVSVPPPTPTSGFSLQHKITLIWDWINLEGRPPFEDASLSSCCAFLHLPII